MMLSTTDRIGELQNVEHHGLVTAEVVVGANVVRDLWASLTDTFGGRSNSYEAVMRQGKEAVVREISRAGAARGANAVVAIRIEVSPANKGTIFIISAYGTAVTAG